MSRCYDCRGFGVVSVAVIQFALALSLLQAIRRVHHMLRDDVPRQQESSPGLALAHLHRVWHDRDHAGLLFGEFQAGLSPCPGS